MIRHERDLKMRKLLMMLAGFLAALSAPLSAEEPHQELGPMAYLPAIAGDYFALDSENTNSRYHIFVRLPEGYASQPEANFPVVYLLDGDSTYPMLAPQHLFLHYDEKLPEAIVVGIAYGGFGDINRRSFDFTAMLQSGEAGGAAAFLGMLESELIPHIEKLYRTQTDRRVLLGQSRGGAFVLYAAVERPALFHGYIASNPALNYPDLTLYGTGKAMPGVQTKGTLILASGSRDREYLRTAALDWSRNFASRDDLPWQAQFMDIEGGTHAASLPEVYRRAMLSLLLPPPQND